MPPPLSPTQDLPDDWKCPVCGADRNSFASKNVEVAGFAENQVGEGGVWVWGGRGGMGVRLECF